MNKKVITFLSLLIVFTLSIIVIIFFSYDKKDRDEYSLKVPESLAIYIYNEKTEKYERKSEVPHGYELNTSKSYCKSGGEVVNYDSYHEYVNYALATDDRCYLYFDIYLPEGYTKLEYIQRTDGQYINTGVLVSGSASTQVEVDWMYTALNNYGTIIGTQGGNHNYILREEAGTNIMRVWGGAQNVELGKVVVGQKNSATIMWGNGKVSASLVLGNRTFNVNTTMTTENASAPLLLFDSNVDGQLGSAINAEITGRAKIYKCNIWINGELEREFVPALDTNGIAGMYDRVEKKFYANAGTGQFKYAISGDELPPEYTQLEYIETNPSSGTQYIDTGFTPTSNTNITYDFEYISGNSGSWIPILGQRVNASSMFALWVNSSNKYIAVNYGTVDNGTTTTIVNTGRHMFSNQGSSFYKDGTLMYTISTSAFSSAGSLIIMGLRESNNSSIQTRNLVGRVYSLKIHESGVLVRNMIPCISPDGQVGMYDTVENKFYQNAGTGTFKHNVNNNKLPEGYTAVSYIESSGTQYIDTGWKPTNINFKIASGFVVTGNAVDQTVFGANEAGLSINLMVNIQKFQFGVNAWQNVENHSLAAVNQYMDVVIKSTSGSQVLTANGQTVASASETALTLSNSIGLFTNHKGSASASTYYTTGRMHYFKAYENGVMVRDLVPCINPYGEVGMYDVVNNKFYGNAGTGVFKAGAPSEYTTLNYIESTGTQYIDTGYSAPEGFYTEFDTLYTSVYGGYIVGSHNLASPYGRNGIGPQHTNFWEIGTGDTCPAGTSTITANTRYHVEASTVKGNSYATVNGTSEVTTTDSSSRSSFNLLLFYNQYSQNTGGDTLSARLYYLKIWDENHELVRVFIPAKNASGTIGLYDALSGNFYTNAGSGTFASG